MDERDYKAMNDELKSAEKILLKYENRPSGWQLDDIIQAMEEYAKKQLKEYGITMSKYLKIIAALTDQEQELKYKLKEKEEEIERLKSSLHASERFRIEDAASSIDDRNILHTKYMECVKQLTKSNEMNERLAELLWKNYTGNDDELNDQIRELLLEYKKSKK